MLKLKKLVTVIIISCFIIHINNIAYTISEETNVQEIRLPHYMFKGKDRSELKKWLIALKKEANSEGIELDCFGPKVYDKDLVLIAKKLGEKLISLNLRGCKQLTRDGLAKALKHLPNLVSLEISSYNITESLLREANLKQLKTVAIECSNLETEKITHFLKKAPNIKSLFLVGLKETSETELIQALDTLVNLDSLFFFETNTSDTFLRKIHLKKLKNLGIRCWNNLTEESLTTFLKNHPHIINLNLCPDEEPCGEVELNSVIKSLDPKLYPVKQDGEFQWNNILQYSSNLEDLCLAGTNITFKELQTLSFKNLKGLHLESCKSIDEKSLATFLKKHVDLLEELDIGCTMLTGDFLKALSFKKLALLEASCCDYLEQENINVFLKNNPKIRSLNLD